MLIHGNYIGDAGCVPKRRHRNLRGNDTFSLVLRFSESFVRNRARGGSPHLPDLFRRQIPSFQIRDKLASQEANSNFLLNKFLDLSPEHATLVYNFVDPLCFFIL